MKEKLVKIQSHQSRVATMRDHLKRSLKEVKKAYGISCNTASCCECSMYDLIKEVETNIAVLEMHLNQGLLEGDIIQKKEGAK